MNIRRTLAEGERLENILRPESIHRPHLEKLVADLQEATFQAVGDDAKARLAALEMRARMVLKRWDNDSVN